MKIVHTVIAICLLSFLPTKAQFISTFAGGGYGNGALGTKVSLNNPYSIAKDALGNIYIADQNNAIVKKIDILNGVINTIAGNPFATLLGDSGLAINARLSQPVGICVDSIGNIYISDIGTHRIRKINATTGIITTFAGLGSAYYGGDGGPATSALLNKPFSPKIDLSGNIIFADQYNHRIRKIDTRTGIITTIAGSYQGFSGDSGLASSAKLFLPSSLCIDDTGNIYISDQYNHRIRKISATTGIIKTVAGNGLAGFSGDSGLALNAKLNYPNCIAIDKSGNLYISDSKNNRIRKIDAASGLINTIAGNGISGYAGDDSLAIYAQLNKPTHLELDNENNIFITDQLNNRIRKIDENTGIISTVYGNSTTTFGGDDILATSTQISKAQGICSDTLGNLFIADQNNHRIRMIDAKTKIITTIAGIGVNGFSGDGGNAKTAKISYPSSLAIDSIGNLYFSDLGNHRIRKISKVSGIITTIAGIGSPGYSGDGSLGTEAKINTPVGICLDNNLNIYFADRKNSRIRVINAKSGIISTFAGNGIEGYGGDDSAAVFARMKEPYCITSDKQGNIYFADLYTQKIRRVDVLAGIITSIAGMGTNGFSGDNGPAINATFEEIVCLAINKAGNLLIGDNGNNRIREIDMKSGIINTVVGSGEFGYSKDTVAVLSAKIGSPYGICVDKSNNIFISDINKNTIRKVTVSNNANLSNIVLDTGSLTPNFSSNIFNYQTAFSFKTKAVKITPSSADTSANISIKLNTESYFKNTSGVESRQFSLKQIKNLIEIKVTANDEISTKSYFINITKAAPVPPSDLIYNQSNIVAIKNKTNINLIPSYSGDTILEFTVSPELPSGITINPMNGIISGKPKVTSPTTQYVVSGSNLSGKTITTLTIRVDDNAFVENTNTFNNLRFYPNPFENEVNLSMPTNDNEGILFILTDGIGQEVLKSEIFLLNNNSVRISNLESLQAGIYFGHFEKNNLKSNSYKLLKK